MSAARQGLALYGGRRAGATMQGGPSAALSESWLISAWEALGLGRWDSSQAAGEEGRLVVSTGAPGYRQAERARRQRSLPAWAETASRARFAAGE